MVDPQEQAPQNPTPEHPTRRRKLAVMGGVALAAVAAMAAMVGPHTAKDGVEARPAPASTTYSPEVPTTEAPTAAPTTEAAKPAKTEIPEQLVEGREKLQVDATNAALSVLRDMDRPNVGMGSDGLDKQTLGNPDDKPDGAPAMLATYVPAENLIKISSIMGGEGEGDGASPRNAVVDVEFQVTPNNPIVQETDQLTTDDFRTAIQDTENTTLLAATAKADGKWLSLSFDEGRVRAIDRADDPNNIYVVDKPDLFDAHAAALAQTMASAQDQLAVAASAN